MPFTEQQRYDLLTYRTTSARKQNSHQSLVPLFSVDLGA
jgi:hypothetical protein